MHQYLAVVNYFYSIMKTNHFLSFDQNRWSCLLCFMIMTASQANTILYYLLASCCGKYSGAWFSSCRSNLSGEMKSIKLDKFIMTKIYIVEKRHGHTGGTVLYRVFLYSTQIGQLSESLDIQQAASLVLNSKHWLTHSDFPKIVKKSVTEVLVTE